MMGIQNNKALNNTYEQNIIGIVKRGILAVTMRNKQRLRTVTTKVLKIKGNDLFTAGTNRDFKTEIRLEPINKLTLIKKKRNQENAIELRYKKDI